MEYMNKTIEELHILLKNKEVTSKELIKESLKKSHEVQEKYNAIINSKELDELLDRGREQASRLAARKMAKVYKKIGLGRF